MKSIIIASGFLIIICSPLQATIQDERTLTVWSYWKNHSGKVEFMNQVADIFQKQHDIGVDITWMSKSDLMEKIMFALDREKVDIIYMDFTFKHPRLLNSLVDLSDLKVDWPVNPSWQMGCLGEKKDIYLPLEGASYAIYYNKALFKKSGIVLPRGKSITGENFLSIIKKLRASGINPIGEGASDRDWKPGIPIMNAIFRFAGPEKIVKLLKGEIKFSDPDVIKGLTFWKQVIDAGGYDTQKAFSLSLSEGIYEVTDGRAAISFCGTWIRDKYSGTERDKNQIGVLDWFTVGNGKGNDYYEMTWVAGYGINKYSRQIAEAKKFLALMLTPSAAALWTEHVGSPYPVVSDKTDRESLYQKLVQQRAGKHSLNREISVPSFASKAADNMWHIAVKEFIMGRSSVEEFAARMDNRM